MRRGETVAAMRHAAEAEESALVAEIFENAGGLSLWMREGLLQLQAADRLLSEEGPLAASAAGARAMRGAGHDGASGGGPADVSFRGRDVPRRGRRRGRDRYSTCGRTTASCAAPSHCTEASQIGSEWCRKAIADLARARGLAAHRPVDAREPGIRTVRRAPDDGGLRFRAQPGRAGTAMLRHQALHGGLGRSAGRPGGDGAGQGTGCDGAIPPCAARRRKANFVLDSVRAVLTKVLLQELSLECNQFASAADLVARPGSADCERNAVLGVCRGERCGRRDEVSQRGCRERVDGGGDDAGLRLQRADAGAREVSVGDANFDARRRAAGRRCRAVLAIGRASGGCERLSGPRRSELEGDGGAVVRAASSADRKRAIRRGPFLRRRRSRDRGPHKGLAAHADARAFALDRAGAPGGQSRTRQPDTCSSTCASWTIPPTPGRWFARVRTARRWWRTT